MSHARRLAWGGLILAALALLAGGLLQRLAVFPRELWLDEAGHNLRLIVPVPWSRMIFDIGWDRQPLLDYLLRKIFWIPLLGHQERDLKLPALICSVATMVAVGALSFRRLGRLSFAAAAVGALALLAWCAGQKTEVWYAGEARHYAFISLLSVLWMDAWLFRRGRWLWALSFAFAATQFFALPIVGLAFLLELTQTRNRRRMLAVAAAPAALYVFMNYWGLRLLLEQPFGELPDAASHAQLWSRIVSGAALLRAYLDYAGAPWWPLYIWAGLAGLGAFAGGAEERRAARIDLLRLSMVWLALVAVVIAARIRSDWWFPDRYFTPFFGLAWATVLLGMRTLATLARGALRVSPALLYTLAALGVLVQATALFHFAQPPAWPSRNFSATEKLFEAEKARGEPLLLLAEPCYARVVPILYWSELGAAPAPGGSLSLASARYLGCGKVAPLERRPPADVIRDFLARPGPKTVAFYRYQVDACAPPPDHHLVVEAKPGYQSCLTLVRDPPDLAAVEAIATDLQFPL